MASSISLNHIITSMPAPVNDLMAFWEACGKKVTDWTNSHFPPRIAIKMQKVFQGLAHSAIVLVLPITFLIPVLGAYYITHLILGPFEKQTLTNIWNGLGVGTSVVTCWNVLTLNPFSLVAAVVYGQASYIFLTQGDLLK